ncbi:MAG: hypothetical protein IPJ30_11445 [Acidobacteria bacterium]|nr:hypothetical protein [Acidobacteriota bacterium]
MDRFVRVVNEVDSLGASVLISYGYDEALVDNLGNWHMATLSVKRSVAGYKHRRQTVKELLISNRQLPVLAEFSGVNVRQ